MVWTTAGRWMLWEWGVAIEGHDARESPKLKCSVMWAQMRAVLGALMTIQVLMIGRRKAENDEQFYDLLYYRTYRAAQVEKMHVATPIVLKAEMPPRGTLIRLSPTPSRSASLKHSCKDSNATRSSQLQRNWEPFECMRCGHGSASSPSRLHPSTIH